MTTKDILNNRFVWFDNGMWSRRCSACNKTISHSLKTNAVTYYKQNRKCNSCANEITSTNRIWTDERRLNHKASLKGKRCSTGMLGKRMSEEHKHKLSQLQTGISKPKSEETKQKMRIAKCRRLMMLGIGTREDAGARQWFNKLNNDGYNFQQNYLLKEQGYYADGYDPDKHIWMEYDTPYHNTLYQKRKDLVRQENIIKHFENIGKPLSKFIRVDSVTNNMVCIYQRNECNETK